MNSSNKKITHGFFSGYELVKEGKCFYIKCPGSTFSYPVYPKDQDILEKDMIEATVDRISGRVINDVEKCEKNPDLDLSIQTYYARIFLRYFPTKLFGDKDFMRELNAKISSQIFEMKLERPFTEKMKSSIQNWRTTLSSHYRREKDRDRSR